jgi:hypothetical protein
MTDSRFVHDFQNPGLALVHALIAAIIIAPDHGEVRNGLKQCCKKVSPDGDANHVLMRVQDVCKHIIDRIDVTRAPRTAQDIHITTMQGVRALFFRLNERDRWQDFQGAVSVGLYAQSLVLIDVFVGPDSMADDRWKDFHQTTLSEIDGFFDRVRADKDLPQELKELVLAQLHLMRESLGKYDVFGLSSFQQSVTMSCGRLTMVLERREDRDRWKVLKEIIDWGIRAYTIGGAIAGGVGLLTFEAVKALPPPKAA